MRLSPLYHWSPDTRRDAIRVEGLVQYKPPTVSSGDLAYPYICLSPSPSAAWGLSGDMGWVEDIESWDLWQVNLPSKAEVHVRPNFGDTIQEVKVYSAIPASCLWYVASRAAPYAKENR